MNLAKYFLLTITFLCCSCILDAQSSSISGTVYSQETNLAIPFSNVALYLEGKLIIHKHTDGKGNYKFESLDSGSFTIQANASGYKSTFDICQLSLSEQKQIVDFKLESPKNINPSLQGMITNQKTGDAVGFANVAIYENGILVAGVESDLDGNYKFSYINEGVYNLEVSIIGYHSKSIKDISVNNDKTSILDINIEEGKNEYNKIISKGCGEPLIKQGSSNQVPPVTDEKIKNLPTRSINGLQSTKAVCGSLDGDTVDVGELMVTDHSSRKEKRRKRKLKRKKKNEPAGYYIDGVYVKKSLIPDEKSKKDKKKNRIKKKN